MPNMSQNQIVNLLTQTYQQTGTSKSANAMGMREMQQRAYSKRDSQYLLIKSPPASGKSRAMMFLALDKLINQGIDKVIITVPEMTIGKSFAPTALSQYGFFADWQVSDRYNLCLHKNESDAGKTAIFTEFMIATLTGDPIHSLTQRVLICTHHSFRYGVDKLAEDGHDIGLFNNVLIGIDEFHHVSADESNRLGTIIDSIINQTSAHVVAMTGSYFRGDSVPILSDQDESRFDKITYTYYEQLNGYEYLKSLGLGYHFYKKSFFDALKLCLDTSKKTIIHIPSVNSFAAETDKYETVGRIIDIIGTRTKTDPETGIMTVKTSHGQQLLVADLVTDDATRPNTQSYLTKIQHPEDMDIIIALGMAKEGFDWEYCEHVLTIGYRGSLTEVVQIIGRATRDSKGKSHAQFTNLIAEPDASQDSVTNSVNDLLKAITLSLLMEQVLKPNINFKRRSQINWQDDQPIPAGTIIIEDGDNLVSENVLNILNQDKNEILATLCQTPEHIKAYLATEIKPIEPEAVSDRVLPSIIRSKYPELNDLEVRQVQEGLMNYLTINSNGGIVNKTDIPDDAIIEGERLFIQQNGRYIDISTLSNSDKNVLDANSIIKERHLPTDAQIYNPDTKQNTPHNKSQSTPNDSFVKLGNKFINVNNLPIDLVRSVNPFHDAYEVLSKTVDKTVLKTIDDAVKASRSTMTEEEAVLLWPQIKSFKDKYKKKPSHNATDARERRMAEALAYLRTQKAKRM